MTVDELKVVITANNADFSRKINSTNQQLVGFQREAKASSASGEKASGAFSAMGKFAAVAAAGVTALRASLNFGKQAVDIASDITEVQNVVDTAFGGMSGMVDEFAQTCIDKFGMSELSAKRTASTYMAMNKGMGLYTKDAAQMAIDAAARTGDIASFFNMSQTEADTMMKSIWTGETESLKRIGVVMTQTNLDAYALSRGFGKTTSAMTQREQVMLRYQYVMDQTRLAAGDFEKTQGTWANQTRILSERWKQFQGLMGQGFIAVLTPVLQLLNRLLSKLMAFAEAFSSVMRGIFGGDDSSGNAIQGIADAANQASGAQDSLASSTEKAAKAAKKALAPFDELNILQTKEDSGTGSTGGGAGTIGGLEIPDIKTPEVDTSSLDRLTEKTKALLEEIRANIPEQALNSFDRAAGRLAKSWKDLMDGFHVSTGLIPKVLGYFTTDAILRTTRTVDAAAALIKIFDGKATGDVAKFGDGWKNLITTLTFEPMEKMSNAFDRVFGTDTLTKILKTKEGIMGWNLSDDSIQSVNLFADGVSRVAKQKVEPFLKQVNALDSTIKSLSWKKELISAADVNAVKTQVGAIRKSIVSELDADQNEALKKLSPLKNIMSTADYNSMLESSGAYYAKQKQSVEDGEARINQIMNNASSQKRQLTLGEQREINAIQEKMKTTGIKHLSESEKESTLILQRLKDNATSLSAQQAAEVVKNSVKARDETIENARNQYTQIRMEADRMLETGVINQEQYNKIIMAAQKSRDDTIKSANEQHNGVLAEAQKQAADLAKNVDWSTGEIKSKYQVFKDDIVSKFKDMGNGVKEKMSDMFDGVKGFFSAEKWKKMGQDATKALQGIFDKFRINIKSPHLKWVSDGLEATGALRKTLEFLSLPTSMPRLDVNWYAQGGIFSRPSIIGVGEAGREAVVPLERNTGWIDSIAQKISERMLPTTQTAPAKPEQPLRVTLQVQDIVISRWTVNNVNAKDTHLRDIKIKI